MVRSRFWALAAPIALVGGLGCSREAPPGLEIKEPEAPTTRVAPPPPAPLPAAEAASAAPRPPPAPPPRPFRITEIGTSQGDLVPLLKDQVERARKQDLRTVVEFYADWCPPCRAFQASLSHPRMVEALRGTFLVKLNLDDWHDKLDGTGFDVKAIPMFYLVGEDGRPTGKILDGDKWGKSTVPNMAAAVEKLLGRWSDAGVVGSAP